MRNASEKTKFQDISFGEDEKMTVDESKVGDMPTLIYLFEYLTLAVKLAL